MKTALLKHYTKAGIDELYWENMSQTVMLFWYHDVQLNY